MSNPSTDVANQQSSNGFRFAKFVLAGALAAVAISGGVAQAASFKHDTSTHKWKSSVSGDTGTTHEYATTYTYGLHEITVWENWDDPFRMSIDKNVLSSSVATSSNGATLDAKNNTVGPNSLSTVDVGADHYITSIQVCTKNDKIKGMRIWGKTINSSGDLSTNEIKSEFKLNNCTNGGTWRAKVSCGDKKIATGIRAYVKSVSKGFSGVTLRCTQIDPL